jgi:hypothetical protein
MENSASFDLDDNWYGGFYELAFELGPRRAPDADAKLLQTLAAIWQDPNLDGCYRDRVEPESQVRVEPIPLDLDEPGHLFGRATLPSGTRVVCGTWVSRQGLDDGVDWVGLYLPLGALGRADERVRSSSFPRPGPSRSWREPIDEWFVRDWEV